MTHFTPSQQKILTDICLMTHEESIATAAKYTRRLIFYSNLVSVIATATYFIFLK